MRRDPFVSFLPVADRVSVAFLDRADGVITGDEQTAAALGIPGLATGEQVHGAETAVVSAPGCVAGVDGLLTATRGLTLTSRSADCQIFVLYAPTVNVAGVLHAGWRGLVSGAIGKWLDVLMQTWNVDPVTLLVGAAPSLCTACGEFTDPARELPGLPADLASGRYVDLRAWADRQFAAAGVTAVERMEGCPRCTPDVLWSYRAKTPEALQGARNVLSVRLVK